MDQYDTNDLPSEQLVFLIASTFGSGEAPENGQVCVSGCERVKDQTWKEVLLNREWMEKVKA